MQVLDWNVVEFLDHNLKKWKLVWKLDRQTNETVNTGLPFRLTVKLLTFFLEAASSPRS